MDLGIPMGGGAAVKRFNMLGTEEVFDKYLLQAISERISRAFCYLEIGIAEGATLIHVADKLQSVDHHRPWQAYGIDMADGPYFNSREFLKATQLHHVTIEFAGNRQAYVCGHTNNSIEIILLKEDRAIVTPETINFCLIDGDHRKEAVMADFLSIEHGMARGGIVAFHDALYEDQWNYPGDGPKHDIHVMEALSELRLTFNCRPGWTLLDTVDGDKSPGSLDDNGNGFAFFQKL